MGFLRLEPRRVSRCSACHAAVMTPVAELCWVYPGVYSRVYTGWCIAQGTMVGIYQGVPLRVAILGVPLRVAILGVPWWV